MHDLAKTSHFVDTFLFAWMAELVDALDSKSNSRKGVGVRFSLQAVGNESLLQVLNTKGAIIHGKQKLGQGRQNLPIHSKKNGDLDSDIVG